MSIGSIMLLIMTSLWSVVYILAIVYSLQSKTHAIPPISLAFNFAWEFVAMLFYWEYVAIVWVIIDVFIVALFVSEYHTKKDIKGVLYLIPFVCWSLLCVLLFNIQIPGKFNGFYFLGFAQDLFMAIEFHFEFKKKKSAKKINLTLWFVALFKLLGDFLAFISSRTIPFVSFFGIFVLFFNTGYIVRISKYLYSNWKTKKLKKNSSVKAKRKNKKKKKKKKNR